MEKMTTMTTTTQHCSSSVDRLPMDAIVLIVQYCETDFTTLRNLVQSCARMRKVIHQHKLLHCDHCSVALYVDEECTIPTPNTRLFSCHGCSAKLCGYQFFDYDRRQCKPQTCEGCGQIECYQCLEAHTNNETNEDGYGTESYCNKCQSEFEFGMGGC